MVSIENGGDGAPLVKVRFVSYRESFVNHKPACINQTFTKSAI
jgi:hypothetical protein